MANIIKIKRKPLANGAGVPSSLVAGELAFSEADAKLFYGLDSGGSVSPIEIAGSGYVVNQITSYAPSKAGVGASGTWNINITGNAATVTSGVYTGRTLTAGSGLTGGGDLSADRTFNIGAGDGITVGADTVAVDSTVVRTTGNQSIGGVKTFTGSGIFDGTFQASYGTTYNVIFSPTQIQIGQGDMDVKLAGNSYYDPNGLYGPTKEIANKEYVTGTLSGVVLTAGSGLTGGGNISASRTFNVGAGDGITVGADTVAVDSTVVRTTGNQNINGGKSFYDSGNTNLIFGTADDIIRVKAPNTSDTTYYFLGLDGGGSPPSSTSADRSIVSRSTSQLKGDIGLGDVQNIALSGVTFTAGSGLTGGGTLAANRTFDVGAGDGISVSADAVAVDSTVVRTTGTQTINGAKTFGNQTIFGSGISASGTNSIQAAATASTATQFAVFTSSPSSSPQTILTRTPTQVKSDIGLSNVTNDAQVKKIASTTVGYVPTWSVTTGDELSAGYSVETTLTGGSGALPRADAVKNYVDSLLGATDAMVFKGTIGSGGTVTSLPTTHSAGWTYRVITAGTYAGQACEIGDLIIAVIDRSGSGNSNSDWTVAQNNLDGAVIGPASATSDGFVLFDGTTGKLIKDGAFTTVPVNKGGTGQTSYTDGQLLIGNTTGNTLTKATLTTGSGISITNGAGSITITHFDTSTLSGLQGGNGISSITVDGLGHITAVGTATYLTSGTVCAAIADCTIDGGTFT